jgi:hypothetical protein
MLDDVRCCQRLRAKQQETEQQMEETRFHHCQSA